jgi:L-alanine-DL-glutamate epimerase-like enolase superfamily enzyme
MTKGIITSVSVATVQASLPAPVIFGDWVMNFREFVVVRVGCADGVEGWAFTLSRDGAVAEHIRKTLAPIYIGTSREDVEATYKIAYGRSPASHSGGIGLRAMSIVDLAIWDCRAKAADESMSQFLGGQALPMPATAIIGYPPALMDADAVEKQVRELVSQGWRRFKAPVGVDTEASVQRLMAARRAAPDAWIGCDGVWMHREVETALNFLDRVKDVRLGWFEDVFAPGNAQIVADLRLRTNVPIAMGDEQGGAYYPEALILTNAVDVVRIDLTCMGGITGGRKIVEQCIAGGVGFAPHMFAHIHSRVFSAWGFPDVPVEWGVPWTGVDPFADSLEQPILNQDGRMKPLSNEPGFGSLINREWIVTQKFSDPEGIFSL